MWLGIYAAGSSQDWWLRRLGAHDARVYRARSLWAKSMWS